MGIPNGILCINCSHREADKWFGENLSILDMVHGEYGGEPWCERCIVERQIEYAKEIYSNIDNLENKLEEIKKNE